jgi:hypothetical protein
VVSRSFSGFFLLLSLIACSGAEPEPGQETSEAVKPGEEKRGPFAARVVSFRPGAGASFGQERMPDVVLGPPQGAGDKEGSLDVVSLGAGGEITLELGVDAVDEPGPDLIVFENAFFANGNPQAVWKDLGEVSVSADGDTWVTFACDTENFRESACAGFRPVYAKGEAAALEAETAGGDAFDLADVGLARARYVKIRDLAAGGQPPNAGFDLDAIAVLHAAR